MCCSRWAQRPRYGDQIWDTPLPGLIHPDRVYINAGAVVGDVLILTKPIGTGVITTALKRGLAQTSWMENAVRSMTTLNRAASMVVTSATGVHAMTDVTGFGLMGHGRELALGSGVTIEIVVDQVPRIEGALDAIHLGAIPAGLLSNRDFAECVSADAPGSQIPDDLRTLLYDPQTAGGPIDLSCSRKRRRPAQLVAGCRPERRQDRLRSKALYCGTERTRHCLAVAADDCGNTFQGTEIGS